MKKTKQTELFKYKPTSKERRYSTTWKHPFSKMKIKKIRSKSIFRSKK